MQPRRERGLVRGPRVVAEALELDERRRERGDAEHVRGAGLVPVRAAASIRPRRSARTRRPRRRRGRRARRRASPTVRRARRRRRARTPCARERQVVDAGCREVDPAVRQQLRGVHREPRPCACASAASSSIGQHLARHVGRAGHRREAAGRRRELGVERLERRGDRGTAHHDSARVPRQEVGVVLDVEHHGLAGHRGCEQVERVGRVAREHDEVVVAGADVAGDRGTRLLDERGRRLRRVAAAAVHARVVRAARVRRAPRPRRARGRMPRRRGSRAAPCRRRAPGPRGRRRPGGERGGPRRDRCGSGIRLQLLARDRATCARRWRSRRSSGRLAPGGPVGRIVWSGCPAVGHCGRLRAVGVELGRGGRRPQPPATRGHARHQVTTRGPGRRGARSVIARRGRCRDGPARGARAASRPRTRSGRRPVAAARAPHRGRTPRTARAASPRAR